MKHMQNISRKTIQLLLLIFVLTFCMAPVSSYADGPWTDRADQSIYDSAGDAPDSSTPDMLDGGIFAELLGEFCIGIGDGLNFLLTSFGCDLNAIIFGRVGGASARTGDVALFSFDMGTGNIYGLVGMAMYGYLRNLVFTLMVPVFLYYLVGFLYSNGNPRVKERLLGMTKLFVASSIGFILFPQLLGIALYLRDAMLHALMTGSQSMILKVADSVGSGVNTGDNSYAFFFGSGGDYNLISQFRAMAKPNGKVVFINSILYVGAVVYQAYLAVCYISAAVCMVVLVLLFPFAALFEMVERGTISNWMRQVLGILLNPVIDSCLLLIPMFFMIIGTAQESKGYRNNPEGLNVYEEEPQKMLEVNVHSSLKPAVTTVSQSQDNNQSSVETVSGPGSKEQPSYQSEVEAVGKDAGAQSGPQVTYTETVSDEDAAIMQQFYEAEIQKPEFRRTMHHAYTDSAVSARQVYSGLKNSMVNATKEERAVANEQIIETAFMQYTNTILDSLDAPEHVDQITYQQAVEDRLREDERGRIEKYLRSKHLLF